VSNANCRQNDSGPWRLRFERQPPLSRSKPKNFGFSAEDDMAIFAVDTRDRQAQRLTHDASYEGDGVRFFRIEASDAKTAIEEALARKFRKAIDEQWAFVRSVGR